MDLRQRLELLRSLAGQVPGPPAGAAQGPAPGAPPADALDLEAVPTPCGTAYVRRRLLPPGHRHGRVPLGSFLDVSPEALGHLARHSGPVACDPGEIGFLDTETTGLAGGTGTYAFVVGVGRFVPGGFRLSQFFLPDYDAEPALLAAVAEELRSLRSVVTYNGKSFDLPLLRNRFILSRAGFPLDDPPHLDLIHPARRVFRDHLPDCALSTVEAAVLGHHREDDVPGHLIPGLYFDFLRTGHPAGMWRVLSHNQDDILALAALAAELGRAFDNPSAWGAGPGGYAVHPWDWLGLGRALEDLGLWEHAAYCYRRAQEAPPATEPHRQALRQASRLHKRRHQHGEAARLWGRLGDVEALVELAKYHEHRRHDCRAAREAVLRAIELVVARRGVGGGTAALLADLHHRLERVDRKLSRAGGGAP